MDSANQRIVLVDEGETIYPTDIADRHHTAHVGFGENDYFSETHKAALCIEHLKTIMIAVKEGADIEVVVKPKARNWIDASFERMAEMDAQRLPFTLPDPSAEFDEKLHDTIMKLMEKATGESTIGNIIEAARQICDACKIKP